MKLQKNSKCRFWQIIRCNSKSRTFPAAHYSTGRWPSQAPRKLSGDGRTQGRIRPWAVIVWLAVWELASLYIGQEILLVSPVSVAKRLWELLSGAGSAAAAADFWRSVAFSFFRIIGGFFLASLAGTLLAALAAAFRPIQELLAPAMATIKAIPVASFIILVLIWVPSRNLSVVISFLMVLPVMYTNVQNGIRSTDRELLEMAEVFHIPLGRRIRYIYLSQLLPFLRSGFSLSLGLCWKAGVAAEVIGIPKGSIGEKLYQAKIYLETADLFAWTLVIVAMSVLFEKCFLFLVDRAVALVEKS